MPDVRAELRVHGRVQGVWYRGSAEQRARALGLVGYAENLDDGTVFIVAEGEEKNVDKLIAWCRVGPPAARVTRVEVTRGPATAEFTGFEIR